LKNHRTRIDYIKDLIYFAVDVELNPKRAYKSYSQKKPVGSSQEKPEESVTKTETPEKNVTEMKTPNFKVFSYSK
jgi:hypothetical protein